MGMESKFIWINGELVPFEKATLHFLTPALHYGAAVFEGIRAYNTPKGPAVFRLREHIERLFDSARVFGFREFGRVYFGTLRTDSWLRAGYCRKRNSQSDRDDSLHGDDVASFV